jgi:hypothetical protein
MIRGVREPRFDCIQISIRASDRSTTKRTVCWVLTLCSSESKPFRRNASIPSSKSKSKPSDKIAEAGDKPSELAAFLTSENYRTRTTQKTILHSVQMFNFLFLTAEVVENTQMYEIYSVLLSYVR